MVSSKHSKELRRLALSVLQPGFVGTEAPDWVLREIGDGLASVVLFSRNIVSLDQVARLTGQLRAENPALIIAIDEEAGDVTRIESATGSTRPGNFALGTVDDTELTESVAAGLGRQLRAAGVSLDYAPSADVNSNPDNPIIGVRSFGVEPKRGVPAHRRVDPGPPVGRSRRLRQALPRPRRRRRRLPPRPAHATAPTATRSPPRPCRRSGPPWTRVFAR